MAYCKENKIVYNGYSPYGGYKLRFLSPKLRFLSPKLTFLSPKLTFLSHAPPCEIRHICALCALYGGVSTCATSTQYAS